MKRFFLIARRFGFGMWAPYTTTEIDASTWLTAWNYVTFGLGVAVLLFTALYLLGVLR